MTHYTSLINFEERFEELSNRRSATIVWSESLYNDVVDGKRTIFFTGEKVCEPEELTLLVNESEEDRYMIDKYNLRKNMKI